MGRAPCCDKNGLKKGPWTPEEDLKLVDYIQKHGPGNWRNLPKNSGLQRCGKSCRLRWTNYLRPDIKRGRFSFEEEETIIQLHSVLGNKWSAIAARLPGRTDNEIKNYWNTHIRKRLLRMGIDPVTHSPRLDLLDLSSILGSSLCNPTSLLNLSSLLNTQAALLNPELLRLASTILSLNNNINIKQENINGTTNLAPQIFAQNTLQGNINSQIPPLVQPNLHDDHISHFQNSVHDNNNNNDGTTQAMQTLDYRQLGLSPNNVTNHSGGQENDADVTNDNNNIATLTDHLVADLPEGSYFQSLWDYTNKDNFGFESVLSTPSSSTTPLHSSSTTTTNVNSGAEDERESYCSNLFKFEIPDSLDISDYL